MEGDTGSGRKAKAERIVTYGAADDGEAISGRGNAAMTAVGGGFLDNQPLRPVFIPKGESMRLEEYMPHIPKVQVDGEEVTGWVMPTAGGGMTDAIIQEVMEKAIVWRWRKRGWFGVKTCFITTDGVGTHISVAFLRWCLKNKVVLLLRCPYGSSKQQPEDIILFLRLKNNEKNGFYQIKKAELGRLWATSSGKITSLDCIGIMKCLKESWQDTFSPLYLEKGFRLGGYRPFTRAPYWELVDKAQIAKAAMAKLTEISALFEKATELNYGGMLQALLNVGASDATGCTKKSSRHAALTGSDLAFLPGGASMEDGVKLAAFKHGFGAIKGMLVPDMRKVLAPYAAHFPHASDKDFGPVLSARILLASAIHAGFGQLPKLWLGGKGNAKVRKALAVEGSKFPVGALPTQHRAPAQAIIKYWGEEVAREEQEAIAGETPEEDPDSGINVAMHALADLFDVRPVEETATANSDSEPTDGPTTALAPTERRRSKRARRPTAIPHARLGGGSM
eukprot:COSAG05_NODE_210_length_14015_cov_3.851785_7_plen_507_part_00